MLTVFLTDDHEVVRRGVGDLLNGADGMKVVGEASTVAQTLARIPALHPDMSRCSMCGCRTAAASSCAGNCVPGSRNCSA